MAACFWLLAVHSTATIANLPVAQVARRSATDIQAVWRMVRCRRQFLLARGAAVAIQAQWRGRRVRQLYLRQLHGMVAIQVHLGGK